MSPTSRILVVTLCALPLAGSCVPANMNVLESSSSGSSGGGDAKCGDGVITGSEACDDGNEIDGDGCNNDCQISGSQVWCKAEIGEDGGGTNLANAVATDSQGHAIVVGQKYNSKTASGEAFVAKYASDGVLVWTTVLPGDGGKHAQGVVVHADDSIVTTTETAAFLLAANGELKHQNQTLEAMAFQRNGLALGPAGLIGFAANTIAAEPFGVIGVLDDSLAIGWTQNVDEEGKKNEATAIDADLEGNRILAGTVRLKLIVDTSDVGPREINEGFVRKYGPDGQLLWSTKLSSPVDGVGLMITAVRTDASNRVVVLGYPTDEGPYVARNMFHANLAPDGIPLQQGLIEKYEDLAFGMDLRIAPNGDRIIVGSFLPPDTIPTFAGVLRYDDLGGLKWQFRNQLLPGKSSGFLAVQRYAQGDLVAVGGQNTGSGKNRALICVVRE